MSLGVLNEDAWQIGDASGVYMTMNCGGTTVGGGVEASEEVGWEAYAGGNAHLGLKVLDVGLLSQTVSVSVCGRRSPAIETRKLLAAATATARASAVPVFPKLAVVTEMVGVGRCGGPKL